jgi:hypothetical protein
VSLEIRLEGAIRDLRQRSRVDENALCVLNGSDARAMVTRAWTMTVMDDGEGHKSSKEIKKERTQAR